MRILFLSDTHLGFGRKHRDYPQRREDAYVGAKNALSLVEKEKVDVILHGGDLFDSLRPSFLTLGEAIDLLTSLPPSSVNIRVEDWRGNPIYERKSRRVPFIAVHGNHDWNKGESNVYILLERAGLLVYAHRRRVVVEKDGEQICVVGVGWIPDKYVTEVYSQAPPSPCEGPSYFLFHQPVKGLYPSNPREFLLPPSHFPDGYTLYLGGHLHWVVDKEIGGKRFLVPGSTVITRLKDGEMERPRIVYIIEGAQARAVEIPGARRAYLVVGSSLEDIRRKIDRILEKERIPPLVKVVLEGRFEEEIDDDVLRKIYGEKALIYLFDRREDDFFEKIRSLRVEVSGDAFTREYVLSLLRERMGEEWEPWMERLMGRLFSGEEITDILDVVNGGVKEKEERGERRTIFDWVGE